MTADRFLSGVTSILIEFVFKAPNQATARWQWPTDSNNDGGSFFPELHTEQTQVKFPSKCRANLTKFPENQQKNKHYYYTNIRR